MQPLAEIPRCSPPSSQDLQWLPSNSDHPNRSHLQPKSLDRSLFSLPRSASSLDRSAPFSPISPTLNHLSSSQYPPPALPQPRHILALDQNSQSINLGPFLPPSQIPSLDSNNNNNNIPIPIPNPFQPASLPVPNRAHPISNIWAQPFETPTPSSSSATSDFDLNSPLPPQGALIGRRLSHLSSNSPHSRSLIGSPSRIADLNNSASLSLDPHRGNLSPASPLSSSFAPNSLPATIYQPWHDAQSSARPQDEERTGRSKARDILGTRPPDSYRDPSVGSIGSPCSSSARSGIGLSNMSPFTGNSLLLPHPAASLGGTLAPHNIDMAHRPSNHARDSSLGAIGSGRMTSRMSVGSSGAIGSGLGLASGSRLLNKSCGYSFAGSVRSMGADSWFMGGRSLSNDLDEDDEFAPPTKSGATSRRHSVSAFTGRSLAQGFESVLSRPSSHNSNLNDKKPNRPMGAPNSDETDVGELEGLKNGKLMMFGSGSSALTEDDLSFSTDLNSLNLNLEAHAHQQQYKQTSFEFSHSSHPQPTRPVVVGSHQPSPTSFRPGMDQSMPPFSSTPWSNPLQPAQPPALPVLSSLGGGHGNRKSSFSAGDPFSASAQASRYFASQAAHPSLPHPAGQPTTGSRFLFSHTGPPAQSSSSLSSPSVTTFSASGLLSTPSPGARQAFHGEMAASSGGGGATMGFEGMMGGMVYALPSGQPHGPISPLSPSFQPSFGHPGSAGVTGGPFPGLVGSYSTSGPTPGPGPNELGELGKGIPLHEIPRDCLLYIVEFKGGRTDLFYTSLESASSMKAHQKQHDLTDGVETMTKFEKGDFVVVEADRGKDLGRVIKDGILVEEVERFWKGQVEMVVSQQQMTGGGGGTGNGGAVGDGGHGQAGNVARLAKEIHPKKIFGKATLQDLSHLPTKTIDESKALSLCRSKALQRGLKMEIRGAEWQWDRRKLTFFFVADKRVDFRELVKDLFRTWKTRIWMCSVNP